MAMAKSKVIIVGAGASGIAAATRLLTEGFKDFVLLEAEDRIGGRVRTVPLDGGVVDLGAQWCHGQEGNIVYDMVKNLNLLSSSYNDYEDNTYFLSDGSVIDKEVTDRMFAVAASVLDDEDDARSCDSGCSFGEFFMDQYKKRLEGYCQDQKLSNWMADWFHKFFMCLDSCPNWSEVSAKGAFTYKYCKGDQQLHWRDKGYKTILDVLMRRIPDSTKELPLRDKILLNKEVNKILWDNEEVLVQCSDGSSYSADKLLLTVSLGVLKTLTVNSFIPQLPPWKLTAINGMCFGTVNKILLKFPTRWWPHDLKGFSLIWTDADRLTLPRDFPRGPSFRGRSWLEDIFGFYVIDSNPLVLLGWVVGEMAGQVEGLSDGVVQEGCMFLLRKFVGHLYQVVEPDAILRSKWGTDGHFRGSYTYVGRVAEELGVGSVDLATPVTSDGEEVLLFAGEATHSEHFSTVHGAIESGYREADRIIRNPKKAARHHKVAIIGAGMAGLGAATTLSQMGIKDFVILEALDRPGGRVQTIGLNDGRFLDLGAQWIHGKDNPLYKLAEKLGLLSETTSEEGLGWYLRENGDRVPDEIVKMVDFTIAGILRECESFGRSPDYPESVGSFLDARFGHYMSQCNDCQDVGVIKRELYDWHVRFQIIDNSCRDLGRLSAKNWGKYESPDGSAHFNLTSGYGTLVKAIVNTLPGHSLLLSTPVTRVRHRDDGVVTLVCDTVNTTCDHLIVTASLGVLKSDSVVFAPPLPLEIRESVRDVGYDGIGKIFLVYEDNWWGDIAGFQLLWSRDCAGDEVPRWARSVSGFDPVFGASNVLIGWVGGPGVEDMEDTEEGDVGAICTGLLRKFVRGLTIPEPLQTIRTSWMSNPWIKGGYSHLTPQCDALDGVQHHLASPVLKADKPRILLAGEAVHVSHYSTTHGAFESGQQQAEVLCEYIRRKSAKL